MLKIDVMVNAMARFELLSMLDAFSRYNLVPLDRDDQLKMCFIKNQGSYCHKVMPIELKNAKATFQCLVNLMFSKNLKAYMIKLGARRGRWAKELHNVLWAYRRTRREPTDESPYAITYWIEVVIPTKRRVFKTLSLMAKGSRIIDS